MTMWTNPFSAGSLRNKPCICGSGKKIKKCHGQSSLIKTKEEYEEIKNLIDLSRKPKITKDEDFSLAQDVNDAKC